MTVELFRNDDEEGATPLTTAAAAHARAALEQAAGYAAALAIARWAAPMGETAALPRRAHWYAQAQDNLQAWLNEGGFQGGAGTTVAPLADADQAPLPFPGSRPRFHTVFRGMRSITD